MTPSIGRIVIAVAVDGNNGATVAPAVIVRVWGERPDGGWTVNLRQFLDGDDIPWLTSWVLYPDEATARAADPAGVAWWPERVG